MAVSHNTIRQMYAVMRRYVDKDDLIPLLIDLEAIKGNKSFTDSINSLKSYAKDFPEEASDEELLDHEGWSISCQSPLELVHNDGSVATGQAARLVIANLRNP